LVDRRAWVLRHVELVEGHMSIATIAICAQPASPSASK